MKTHTFLYGTSFRSGKTICFCRGVPIRLRKAIFFCRESMGPLPTVKNHILSGGVWVKPSEIVLPFFVPARPYRRHAGVCPCQAGNELICRVHKVRDLFEVPQRIFKFDCCGSTTSSARYRAPGAHEPGRSCRGGRGGTPLSWPEVSRQDCWSAWRARRVSPPIADAFSGPFSKNCTHS